MFLFRLRIPLYLNDEWSVIVSVNKTSKVYQGLGLPHKEQSSTLPEKEHLNYWCVCVCVCVCTRGRKEGRKEEVNQIHRYIAREPRWPCCKLTHTDRHIDTHSQGRTCSHVRYINLEWHTCHIHFIRWIFAICTESTSNLHYSLFVYSYIFPAPKRLH